MVSSVSSVVWAYHVGASRSAAKGRAHGQYAGGNAKAALSRAHDRDVVQKSLARARLHGAAHDTGVTQHRRHAVHTSRDELVERLIATADLDHGRRHSAPGGMTRRRAGKEIVWRQQQLGEKRARQPGIVERVAIVHQREGAPGMDVDQDVDLARNSFAIVYANCWRSQPSRAPGKFQFKSSMSTGVFRLRRRT